MVKISIGYQGNIRDDGSVFFKATKKIKLTNKNMIVGA